MQGSADAVGSGLHFDYPITSHGNGRELGVAPNAHGWAVSERGNAGVTWRIDWASKRLRVGGTRAGDRLWFQIEVGDTVQMPNLDKATRKLGRPVLGAMKKRVLEFNLKMPRLDAEPRSRRYFHIMSCSGRTWNGNYQPVRLLGAKSRN